MAWAAVRSKAVVLLLLTFFIVTLVVGVCNCSMFCCTLLYVHSSIAIILMWKRELVALLNLSSWCLVVVGRLFLAMPGGCLQFVIVVFPDHTHLLFLIDIIKRHYQCTLSFAKHTNCLNFLKQQDKSIDFPHAICFKAYKQREYDRIHLTAE